MTPQLTEHEMRADRVFRVAEPPARIAEPNLRDARLDAELELVVHAHGRQLSTPFASGAGRRRGWVSGRAG
jgi:hypothetical protein